jgi:hypothetical protein
MELLGVSQVENFPAAGGVCPLQEGASNFAKER